MNTSVEISYYPLRDEYIPPIKSFIARLHKHRQLEVSSDGMSTKVFGPYKEVMRVLSLEIETAFEVPHSVFVLKIVNADLNIPQLPV